jgi:hypothetical protein
MALMLAVGVTGQAQDQFVGRWEGTVESVRGSRPATLTVTKTGDTYAGTLAGVRPDADTPLKDIKIAGDTLTATSEITSPQGSLPITFVFTLQGEAMKGKGDLSLAGQPFTFTLDLKRVGSGGQTTTPQLATPPTDPQPGRATRKSAPQPLQKQSLDYFVGRWEFTWLGRDSQMGSGSRKGTVTYARTADGKFLEGRAEGQSDDGKYQESSVVGFDEEKKILAIFERRPNGLDMLSLGDWTAAITIRFNVSPVKIKTQTVQLRRTLSVLSATSFNISEEFSVDGGPFQRLGDGSFNKVEASKN